jgi:hypothetical protein
VVRGLGEEHNKEISKEDEDMRVLVHEHNMGIIRGNDRRIYTDYIRTEDYKKRMLINTRLHLTDPTPDSETRPSGCPYRHSPQHNGWHRTADGETSVRAQHSKPRAYNYLRLYKGRKANMLLPLRCVKTRIC